MEVDLGHETMGIAIATGLVDQGLNAAVDGLCRSIRDPMGEVGQ